MKQTRQLSLYTRSFLSHLQALKPHPNANSTLLTSLSASPSLRLRLLSSKTDPFIAKSNSLHETNSLQSQNKESFTDVEDVSNEELKRRIEKYFEGDEEAIPSIFEAILKRKLAGKHDELDDELMEEFQHNPPDDVSDEGIDSEEDILTSSSDGSLGQQGNRLLPHIVRTEMAEFPSRDSLDAKSTGMAKLASPLLYY